MFNFIARWLLKRREERKRMQYESGFGFIMTEYFLHRQPLSSIRDHIDAYSDDNDPFDIGSRKALDVLENNPSFRFVVV